METVKLSKKENFMQLVTYCCCAASAGVVQIVSFTLLLEFVFHDEGRPFGPSYLLSLLLSVLWNFTVNRRFTFKSAANIPSALLKFLGYCAVFAVLSTLWGTAITDHFTAHWVKYATEGGTMLVNGVTDFLFMRFIVFGRSINTSASGQAYEARKRAAAEAAGDGEK